MQLKNYRKKVANSLRHLCAYPRPPWGTLVCFNLLFVFNESPHSTKVSGTPVKRISLCLL